MSGRCKLVTKRLVEIKLQREGGPATSTVDLALNKPGVLRHFLDDQYHWSNDGPDE